jgi:hypothetical protein
MPRAIQADGATTNHSVAVLNTATFPMIRARMGPMVQYKSMNALPGADRVSTSSRRFLRSSTQGCVGEPAAAVATKQREDPVEPPVSTALDAFSSDFPEGWIDAASAVTAGLEANSSRTSASASAASL